MGKTKTRCCVFSCLAAILSRENATGTVAMGGNHPISFQKNVYQARLQGRIMADGQAARMHEDVRKSAFQQPLRQDLVVNGQQNNQKWNNNYILINLAISFRIQKRKTCLQVGFEITTHCA